MYPHRLAVLCLGTFATLSLIAAGCKKASEGSGAPAVSSPSKSDEPPGPSLDETPLAAAKQASVNNLYRLALAMLDYEENMQAFPTPGYDTDRKRPAKPWDPVSWRVKLLPYIEQANLYRQIDPQLPIPQHVAKTAVPIYANPLEKAPTPMTHYRVFVGGGAMFDLDQPIRFTDVSDGTSNTILIVESATPVDWSKPEDFRFDPSQRLPKLGIFPGGFHAVMADGSVRWIPDTTPEATIKAMITRAGGEPVPIEDFAFRKPTVKPKKDIFEGEKLKSISNLAQIGIALHNYESAHRSFPSPGLPKGMIAPDDLLTPHSWRVAILPFIEQQNLWKQIPDERKGPLPRAIGETVVKLYLSPFNKEPYRPLSYYRVFVGNGAAFDWGRRLRMAQFTDGLSNTILAVESSVPVEWTSLDDFHYDPNKPLPKLGIFDGGFHALMGDGAVLWVPSDTDEATIRAMITRNGGEKIKLPGRVVKPGFIAKKE